MRTLSQVSPGSLHKLNYLLIYVHNHNLTISNKLRRQYKSLNNHCNKSPNPGYNIVRVRAERACRRLSMRKNLVWSCQEGNRRDLANKWRGLVADWLADDKSRL